MSPSSNRRDYPAYRPDIDGLRAVAVLAVVAFHAFPRQVPGGFIGVDVFFVISGYLIGAIILKGVSHGSFSFLDFYARRIRRIFPALVLVLAACLVAGRLLLLPDEFELLGKHVLGAAAFVSNFVLNAEAGYFDVAANLKPLLHLWSLGIEEQFYIFLPITLFLAARIKMPLLPLVAAIALVSFALNVWEIGNDPIAAFYLPTTRFWELLAGCVLAGVTMAGAGSAGDTRLPAGWHSWLREPFVAHTASIAGIIAILAAALGLNAAMAFPGWLALLPVGGAVLLIAAGPDAVVNRFVLTRPWIVYVGLISYPLYLWHWPLISFAWIVESGRPEIWVRVGLIVLSFVLAALTFHFVEKPIRFGGGPTATLGLIGSAVAVAVAGFLVSDASILGRPPSLIAKLAAERLTAVREGKCHWKGTREPIDEFMKSLGDCMRIDPARRNILVVGDSLAADTWLALSQAYPEVNFLQATGGGCKPIEAKSEKPEWRKGCGMLLGYVKRDFAGLAAVDGVLLTARWDQKFQKVMEDVAAFRQKKVPVAVLGPTFEYKAPISKLAARGKDVARSLEAKATRLDERMKQFFEKQEVPYASKIAMLCAETCPSFSEDGEPLLIDKYHWTAAAARRFGPIMRDQHVLENLFGPAVATLPTAEPPPASATGAAATIPQAPE